MSQRFSILFSLHHDGEAVVTQGAGCPGPRDQRGHAGCMAALPCVSMAGHKRARARDTVTRELELETLSLSDDTTCREAADTLLPLRPPRTLYTATAAGNAGNPYSTVQYSTVQTVQRCGKWQVHFQRWNILRDNPCAFSQLDIHSTRTQDTAYSTFIKMLGGWVV